MWYWISIFSMYHLIAGILIGFMKEDMNFYHFSYKGRLWILLSMYFWPISLVFICVYSFLDKYKEKEIFKAYCYGESVSLRIKSAPEEDSNDITFDLNNY